MMPPTTTGAVTPTASQLAQGLGHEVEMRTGEDREPDDVDVFVTGRGRDLRGREADALVHDLHAGITRRHRDLLGTVRVAVESGLADEDADRLPVHRGADPVPDLL